MLAANPEVHAWVQIPLKYFDVLIIGENNFRFNFDNSVVFSNANKLPRFYLEVFKAYNKAYVTDLQTFETNIRGEIIWANKFITKNIGKKKNVLFLRNWIRSGIVHVSDLRFINGRLDENYVYERIQDKRNIYTEIVIVKSALIPHRHLLQIDSTSDVSPSDITMAKSKHFYKRLIELKTEHVDTSCPFLTNNSLGGIEYECFKHKVSVEKEIKLKEFNFKALHGILPCNYNLKKWRMRASDRCDVCNSKQTIEHLLLDCTYVKPLWNKMSEEFGVNVTFPLLLGSNRQFQFHALCTIITFVIYKEWLLLSLQNKGRSSPLSFHYLKSEIALRTKIYRKCKSYEEMDFVHLDKFVERLLQDIKQKLCNCM